MMQASYTKIDEILFHYLIVAAELDNLLSFRAERLYRKLLKTSMQKSEKTFQFNYKKLEGELEYTHDSLRRAFIELEDVGLAYRDKLEGTRTLHVKIDTKIIEQNLTKRL